MASNVGKSGGVVNYKKGKCIDSRGKDWNWLDWNSNDGRTPWECVGNDNQKFMIEKVDDWYKVGINQNGYKCINAQKWRFAPAGNAPLMDNICNNYETMKWDYDFNSKKLRNRGTQQCLAYNEGEDKFQMSNCSDENDENQAFIAGGAAVYNSCRNFGLSHKQCSPSNLDKRDWLYHARFANDAPEVAYCMDEAVDKQTCINNACKKPSNSDREGCSACQSDECNLARQCKKLDVPDNLCISKSTIDSCEEFGLKGDKCTTNNTDSIRNQCTALGLLTAASGYNCNTQNITDTLATCATYGLKETQCSIKSIDQAKQQAITQAAIEKALKDASTSAPSIYTPATTAPPAEFEPPQQAQQQQQQRPTKKTSIKTTSADATKQQILIAIISIIVLLVLGAILFF